MLGDAVAMRRTSPVLTVAEVDRLEDAARLVLRHFGADDLGRPHGRHCRLLAGH
jgi:hypothetical protein